MKLRNIVVSAALAALSASAYGAASTWLDALPPETETEVAYFSVSSTTHNPNQYLTQVEFEVWIWTSAYDTYGAFFVTSMQGGTDGNISGPSWNYVTQPIFPQSDDLMEGNGPWSRGCLCGQYYWQMTIDPTPQSGYSNPANTVLRIPASGLWSINCTA